MYTNIGIYYETNNNHINYTSQEFNIAHYILDFISIKLL